MPSTMRLAVPFLFLTLLFASCGGSDPNRKEVFPVTGEVYVDGAPVAQVAVQCTNVAGIDSEQPTVSKAITNEEGKFEISTYESADGVPEGDYVLTFTWGDFNAISRSFGPDKFKGKYADPKKSEHKFSVVTGKPTDLGRFDLTTK